MATASTTNAKPSASAILFVAVQIGAAWLLVPVGYAAFYVFQWARAGNDWLNKRAFSNLNRFDRWLHG
jgi:hypothetical protein